MYSYIITGDGHKAMPVRSDALLPVLREYVRMQSKRLNSVNSDTVFKWGTMEFINPHVLMPNDYAQYGSPNTLPALINP